MLETHMDDIRRICVLYRVSRLYVFGSALTGNLTPASDIDLIVDFSQVPLDQYADNYFHLKAAFEKVLDKPVDLLEEQAIRNPYFKQEVQQNRRLVYEH